MKSIRFGAKHELDMKKFFVWLLILSWSAVAVAAQSAAVDAFVNAEMAKQKIPGVSVAVVRDGQPIKVKGYGFANLEHKVAVKPETIFQSGSVGKQFTAMAVMILVEEGRMKLDAPISTYLGQVPPAWRRITVRHLLTHTGGLTDYPAKFDYRRDYKENDLLMIAKRIPLDFAPGEKWSYSNLGYVVLGVIIHKVTGKFYGDFLQERIFKPLEMTTARIISEEDIVENRAAGYRLVKGEIKNQEWVSPSLNTTADGALYLTAFDMVRWETALAGGKLISKAGYEEMWTPVKLNNGKTYPYGFAWDVERIDGRLRIQHSGAWQGFESFIVRYPDDKLTVIVFANLTDADIELVAHGVADLYLASARPK